MDVETVKPDEDPWATWNDILNEFLKETEIRIIEFEYSAESPLWKFVYTKINYPNHEELERVLDELREKDAHVVLVLYRAEWESDETGVVALDQTGYPIF
jgi:hypothetical protein